MPAAEAGQGDIPQRDLPLAGSDAPALAIAGRLEGEEQSASGGDQGLVDTPFAQGVAHPVQGIAPGERGKVRGPSRTVAEEVVALDFPGGRGLGQAGRGGGAALGVKGAVGFPPETRGQGKAVAEVGGHAHALARGHALGGVPGIAGLLRAHLALDVRQLVPDRLEDRAEIARVLVAADTDLEDGAQGLPVESLDGGCHREEWSAASILAAWGSRASAHQSSLSRTAKAMARRPGAEGASGPAAWSSHTSAWAASGTAP